MNDKNRDAYRPTALIVIGDNVYIRGNCTIYPGTKILGHSIIAPNSVVNRNMESNTMFSGVLGKIIKKIN